MISLTDRLGSMLEQNFPKPAWKGFVIWWLLAKGLDFRGKDDYWTDGTKDGGFDAIAWPLPGLNEDDIYVIQSKYYTANQSVTDKDLDRFISAIDAMLAPRDVFDEWIETVKDNLIIHYEKLRKKRDKIKFVVITTGQLKQGLVEELNKRSVMVCGRDSIERLYGFYMQGQTPRVHSLKLGLASPLVSVTQTKKVKMWIFATPLKELAEAYRDHGDLLFAGNVRLALKGEGPAKVRSGIDDTLRSCPEEFVFSHNGIAMIARDVKSTKKSIALEEPSIVNGAQTVTHLGRKWLAKLDGKNATVLVKLIEVLPDAPFERLETDIAIRSNTQNKVDFSDLTVNEPALVTLQRELMRKNVFLERKRGESPPFNCRLRTNKERLVQLMACVEPSLGPTDAKRKQDLFKRAHALRMLRNYVDKNKINNVIAYIWIDDVLRDVLNGYAVEKTRKRAKIAAFAVFASLVKSLHEVQAWNYMVKELAETQSATESLKERIGKIIRLLIKHMLQYSKKAKKNEPAFYKNKEETAGAVERTVMKIKKAAKELKNTCLS